MGLTLITPPTSEPITPVEARQHMRVDINDEDVLIASYIKASRIYAEGQTRRAFVTQTWDYTLPGFPSGAIELPIQPVISITSVNYVNTSGNTVSWSAGSSPDVPSYDVTTDGPRTRIFPKYDTVYPDTRIHGNAVTVRFVAGYTTFPEDIKQLMYLLTAHFFEMREPVIAGGGFGAVEIPLSVEALMSPYMIRGF